MPIIDDPRYSGSALIGQLRTDLFARPATEEPALALLDTLASASRQVTLAGAAYARLTSPDPDLPDAPPDYDPLDNIQGFERYAPSFIDARTPSEVEGIKSRIRSEEKDREVLARAGIGPAAEIGLSLLDPTFLVAIAVPELAIVKAARVGRSVNAAFQGAASAAAYEVGLQSLQETRSAGESALVIGGGALLGGVLGSLGGRAAPGEVPRALNNVRSEVGAAAVARPTTLAEESLARGGEALSKGASKVPFAKTDLQIVMESDSIAARVTLQELADVAPILTKNEAGIATPTSVEAMLGRSEGVVAQFSDTLGQLWSKYRTRLKESDKGDFPLPADERLTKDQFYAAVSGAARRGDRALVPEVEEGAKALRRVFDPLKVEAQRLGLLPKDIELIGAESYVRRMYDRDAIRANRAAWDQVLIAHFMRAGGTRVEAVDAAESVTRKILGGDVGQANFNVRTDVPTAGPLHDRVLDIPDELIEPFLINDPVKVATAYTRELAPEVEITKRFGDKDMKDAFDKIKGDYEILRERLRSSPDTPNASEQLSKLEKQERATLEALTRVRDRIYGRAGRLSPDAGEGERRAVMAARDWRNLVAGAKLGGTALTGGTTDLARIVGQSGFAPTISKLVKLATSPAFRALSREQARRVGAAVEVAMSRRVNTAFDGAVTEGWSQALANGVYKYSGLNHVTDFLRTLSATLLEDTVLKAASDVAAGRALPKFTRTRLASLGIDDDALRRINEQVARHGGTVDGVSVSGSANWDDYDLSQVYDAAILKESRMTVMEPGAADRVWWMDSETGKVIGQLKSFSLAAPVRLTMGPVQMLGQRQYAQAARFAGAMMIGGYLAHSLRQLAAGREPTTDLQAATSEAFVESGLGGVLPDLISPVGRRFGIFGESARFSDRNVLSTFGGPALGTLGDAYDLAFNRTANGVSASDLQLMRRLLPYQNLWYLRRAINALEGETAEALDLPGADTATFGERFIETKPLLPSAQRGGTGTGQIVQ